jgi:DUF3025 family protein
MPANYTPAGMEPWDPRFAEREGGVWFAPVRPYAARFAALPDWPTVEEIDARLAPVAGVRFVAAAKARPRRRRARPLDLDAIYEIRIARRGEVPTRPGSWHDFLNALVWAAFPAAKRALTARLHAEKEAQARAGGWRLPNARTPLQDALSMLDEGGVLEPAGGGAVVFGHAILEHLVAGRWPRAFRVPLAAAADLASLDRALAERLAEPAWLVDERLPAAELASMRS